MGRTGLLTRMSTRPKAGPRRPSSSSLYSVTTGDLYVIAQPAPVQARGEVWLRLARRARMLSWLSLAWLTVEGTVAVAAGVMAGSVALVAFGLDSAIEGMASVVIVWRFSGSRMFSDTAERRAQVLVAIQFFILAPFIAYEALDKLIGGGEVDTTWLGIGLTLATLAICQPLGYAKRRLGRKLASDATVGEGLQNLLCGYLAVAVLVGLVANALFGLWWLDPLVALAIAGVAVQEGRKALRGETCSCGACVIEPLPLDAGDPAR
jgi:divalent metal cation (Fe/Co/Zn/Cd) transporter